ncbi:MAG: NADPH:quinone oxidoreductase family protein [Ilumatobacteraceae bacterium]|nr:NADPH:quinone oxidoreductase family protein [Ilumatobacteraceae bacterium]
MRTLVCKQFGPLDDLVLEDQPTPALGESDVRIAVTACGVNFVDALLCEGKYQIKPPLPFRPGSEVVGRITEVGSSVTSVSVGERVFAPVGFGGFADEVVTHSMRVFGIPEAMSDGQGATFMQSYLTGWFALVNRANVEAGKTMLVLGAGGGVGLAAVDLGRALGLRVIAAASSADKRELAASKGAFATIDTSTEDVKERAKELAGGGIDYLYDPVGGDLGATCLRAIGEDGQYLVVGFVGGIQSLPANQVLLRNRRITGVDWGAWVGRHPKEHQQMLKMVLEWIADGRLNPVEPKSYPLSAAVQALKDMQNRKVAGKVILVP